MVPGTLLDCPVIGVPVGFNDEGLPMGMQIIGKNHADFAVLQLAHTPSKRRIRYATSCRHC